MAKDEGDRLAADIRSYRLRAQGHRATAGVTKDAGVRKRLLALAAENDRLADELEVLAARKNQKSRSRKESRDPES
jgi:hypothetical protein